MNKYSDMRTAIADICHRLYDRSYVVATSGNVSARGDRGFFITPTMTRKDLVTPELVVACDSDGKPCGGAPSSEVPMHRFIYRARPDVGAAIHAHPRYCLACSLSGISATGIDMPELTAYLGEVPLVPYATPGTEEMAESLKPFIAKHDAFILERHGVLVLGANLLEAFDRLEHLEHVACVSYLVNNR